MSTTTAPIPAAPLRLGWAVAAAQFALAISWTVYVVFLPSLAQQAGLPPSAVLMLLMVDQAVFLVADYACGVLSDRMRALNARFGPALAAVTGLSAAAFLALPWVAPQGSPALFIAVTLVWTATSSALRAPPMNLMARHSARPQQPALLALAMLGLGVAAAVAPYLALTLKGLDPRVPFVMASAGVMLAAVLLAWAERKAAAAPAPNPATVQPPAALASAPSAPALRGLHWSALALAAVLAALAFQVHGFLNSTPLYQRFAGPEQLVHLAPAFWVGFNIGLWPASRLASRFGPWPVVAAAALAAALLALASALAPTLAWLVTAQVLAGVAWAALLAAGFDAALALGQGGRQGRTCGALSSALAFSALLRMGLVAGGTVAALRAEAAWVLQALPVVLWVLAGALLAWSVRGRLAGRGVAGSAPA